MSNCKNTQKNACGQKKNTCGQQKEETHSCNCQCQHEIPCNKGTHMDMGVCGHSSKLYPMLQTYTTKVLQPTMCCGKKVLLTQQMMACEDYKYVIRWDFDLGGKTILVPENCILEFDGGTLRNGTIIGQDTYINDVGGLGVETLFGPGLTREGTWRMNEGGGSFEQVQSDWNETNPQSKAFIKNKPADVGTKVQSDWNQSDSTKPDYIKNKPTIPSGGGDEDKPYDPDAHSGLGRKTLELGEDGSNVLTQDDFDRENTIYVVKYDFDLGGAEIQIPAGCVLDMDGGSLNNGKVISNDTKIIGVIPQNPNNYYGFFYKDGNPLTYNLKTTKRCSTAVRHAFLTPGGYVSFKFYPQGIAAFYYNNSKYHVLAGNIEDSIPERTFLLLFDNNYKYLGSTELPYEGHGGGLAVCDNELFVATSKNPNSTYPDKVGIGVYTLANVVNYCMAENTTPHTDTYTNKIPSSRYVSLYCNCYALDYDFINEEFVVLDGDAWCHIYDKNFNEIRISKFNVVSFFSNEMRFHPIIQGLVLKNGIVYGTIWYSDYPDGYDRGNNMFYAYDTIKDKVVSYERLSSPYQDAEIEGLYKDPDNDDNMYYLLGSNTDNCAIVAICQTSQVNDLYGIDTKREGKAGTVSDIRSSFSYVDNSYDFSMGPSTGSSIRPFATLDAAIACSFSNSSEYVINVIGSQKEYVLPRIRFANRTLNIIGINNPVIRGSFWSFSGTIRLNNLKLISNSDICIYVSSGGYVYTENVEIEGNQTQTGVRIRDKGIAMLNIAISNFGQAIDCVRGILSSTKIHISDCRNGISMIETENTLSGVRVENCTGTGIYNIRSQVNIHGSNEQELRFKNVATCFGIDDSFINVYPYHITFENVDWIIKKDIDFKGRVNLMLKASNEEELTRVFNFVKQGKFVATSVGFYIDTQFNYNGIEVLKGTYSYNNPGFNMEGYRYTMIQEANGEFIILPTRGTTAKRPSLDGSYRGFRYYDTEIDSEIVWSGNRWVDNDETEKTYELLGELSVNSTTFSGLNVSVTKSTYTSSWSLWTHAVDNIIYKNRYVIDGIPFNEDDKLLVKLVGANENFEWSIALIDDNDNGNYFINEHNLGTYNAISSKGVVPSKNNYNKTSIVVNCDSEQFGGVIRIYKKQVS